MSPGGDEVVARWREAGEWWLGEPSREFVRTLDAQGKRRESVRELPVEGPAPSGPLVPLTGEGEATEEWSLRIHKRRDEKVAQACGAFDESGGTRSVGSSQTGGSGGTRSVGSAQTRGTTECAPPEAAEFAALHCLSGYAFGRSSILAEEIPLLAAAAGASAACIADPFSLVGAHEFVSAARKVGVKPLVGATFELDTGGEIVLVARSKQGYESLSRLVTACHLGEPRLHPLATWNRLAAHSRDLLCLTGGDAGPLNAALAKRKCEQAARLLERLTDIYGRANVAIQIERTYLPWEIAVNQRLLELAEATGTLAVAAHPVLHPRREQFPAQDVLVCAQTLCTVDEVLGRKPRRHPDQPQVPERPARSLNAERHMLTASEMAERFADRPDLLANTLRFADRCDDDVLPARTRLPTLYQDAEHVLKEAVWAGAHRRYPTIKPALKRRIAHELDRIVRLNFSGHFLVMWDACRWAEEQDIHYSGRGSVVDSVVAYCLGFSRIDAFRHKLHFDRFLPEDGSKRPDIDIDFEAKRRDDVRNYLTLKYGQDHVATVAAIGAYCSRGIIREVGKALGLPDEAIGFLAKRLHGGISADRLEESLATRPELRDSAVCKVRFRWVFALAERLMDVPRNMRCHSSGVVVSSRPLCETVPVMWSAAPGVEDDDDSPNHLRIIQWDKRTAKHYFDKFDILCLRGQDVLSGTERRIRVQDATFSARDIGTDDPEMYRAMRSGELIGIPQSASPAMRQAHIRMRTQDLHDASLVQAGIRPGVGGAVKINELIARRRGKPYTFLHPDFEAILGITYGIIVFQEQVDQLLQTFGGYSSGEAEDLRDAIHKRRREDYGRAIREQLLARVLANGYDLAVAEHVYELVAGFKGYGFAQGHALAFAEISLRSVHCQQQFPAEYFASLLDAQPAGYYGPCTLVNEARTRGVRILPPDVCLSEDGFAVEDVRSDQDPQLVFPNGGIRVALAQVEGLSAATRSRIAAIPKPYRFGSLFDFAAHVRPDRDELENLVLCGAFDRLHPNRRAALWAIPDALRHAHALSPQSGDQPVLPLTLPEPPMPTGIADFSPEEKALHERRLLGLDVERHLMAYERDHVASRGGIPGAAAKRLEHGRKAIVVGNPIRLRFPPTPSGKRVVFFDLEDETGLLNVTCFDAVYQRDGHAIVCSPYVTLIGEAQDRDGHTAFLASRVFPYHPRILRPGEQASSLPVVTRDFLVG